MDYAEHESQMQRPGRVRKALRIEIQRSVSIAIKMIVFTRECEVPLLVAVPGIDIFRRRPRMWTMQSMNLKCQRPGRVRKALRIEIR